MVGCDYYNLNFIFITLDTLFLMESIATEVRELRSVVPFCLAPGKRVYWHYFIKLMSLV